MEILIKTDELEVKADLFDTSTGRSLYEAVPFEAEAKTWGDEIYFEVPVVEELDETAKEVVEIGDIGYWPTGKAMCLFFGPTPMSRGDEIRPASAVNIIGRIDGDATVLKGVPPGTRIRISKYRQRL